MCFGGDTATPPSNPAPYSLANSASAVKETATPASATSATGGMSATATATPEQDTQQSPLGNM